MEKIQNLMQSVITGHQDKQVISTKIIRSVCIFENLKRVCNRKGCKMDIDKSNGKIKHVHVSIIGIDFKLKPRLEKDNQLYFVIEETHSWMNGLKFAAAELLGEHVNYTPKHMPMEYLRKPIV